MTGKLRDLIVMGIAFFLPPVGVGLSIAAGIARVDIDDVSRTYMPYLAALLIVLPNGLVKIINALPFVCGDFRLQSLSEIWGNFRRAWQDPRVANFINDLAGDAGKTRTLHQWVHL